MARPQTAEGLELYWLEYWLISNVNFRLPYISLFRLLPGSGVYSTGHVTKSIFEGPIHFRVIYKAYNFTYIAHDMYPISDKHRLYSKCMAINLGLSVSELICHDRFPIFKVCWHLDERHPLNCRNKFHVPMIKQTKHCLLQLFFFL